MLKDLIIFHKAYEFLKWAHVVVSKFPRSEKFVLAQRINNSSLDLLAAVIEANAGRNKAGDLPKVELSLEKLRIWFRLGFDLKHVNIKQYENSARMLDEIGRLLGGWKKNFPVSGAAGAADGEAKG